ncbi:Holliday junction resolvase RecU [Tumebacillus permanentifrigoris]|uniref:Holliday junction resolvase RecU n=1 Tax=Tumebacillus permanentifrigoris TaxID=378543 RepID=A0A316D2W7_9BACL|nr:Holliday junction resolvase RecU [Tumebacillus permanentifrigoris]PWK05271.1 recombination protein U [Tumebacillus permanentifrigoris]
MKSRKLPGTTQANRGMGLERLLDMTNNAYRNRGQADVNKRPTPVKIQKRLPTGGVVGFLEKASTVDYDGTYRRRSLQFEAKSTKIATSFAFDNLHKHQVEHLRRSLRYGAIAFLIIEFATRHETYFVPAPVIITAWDEMERGGRKSITYDHIREAGELIKPTNGVPLDYLVAVDKWIEIETQLASASV